MEEIPQQRRGGVVNTPVLGPEVPQFKSKFFRWLGTTGMRLMGWKFAGTIPNVPKLVAIGAPHTSYWDVFISLFAFQALGVKLSWMLRASSVEGVFGFIWRWLGAVPVERGKSRGVVGQMVAHFNNSDQFVLALSPKGTRKKGKDWKTGFYYIAHQANVPILCVAIDFGRKTIRFHPLFSTTGDIDADYKLLKANFADVIAKNPELA